MSNHDDQLGQPEATGASVPEESKDTATPKDRRHFVAGVVSALGVGALVHSTGSLTGGDKSGEVRGRIVSRIQDELKRSQSELLQGYDKPDGTGSHGRYNKNW